MARPRKRENQGLPQNLLCRKRQRKNGKIVKRGIELSKEDKLEIEFSDVKKKVVVK